MKRTSTLRTANSGRGHVKEEAENEERRIEDGREAEYSTMELVDREKRRECWNEQTARARHDPPVLTFPLSPPA